MQLVTLEEPTLAAHWYHKKKPKNHAYIPAAAPGVAALAAPAAPARPGEGIALLGLGATSGCSGDRSPSSKL
jgi:hypothetical protein